MLHLRLRALIATALVLALIWPLVHASNAEPRQLAVLTRFAAVGDFWSGNPATQAVADLISGWNPDFVVTVGDNNYSNSGTTAAWDTAVGQYFGKYIRYPLGSTSLYSPGSPINRFFPALGNHDWDAGGYTNYFDLPGKERYYDFLKGPVHIFVLDSDRREPDGTTASSLQGQWLQTQLAASTAPWKIVIFHHPAYSSAQHGNSAWMQWPFQEWGASLVMAGHDHDYERIVKDGFPYLVNGFGGRSLYNFVNIDPDSRVRYNTNYGAMLLEATPLTMTLQAYSIADGGTLIDSFTLDRAALPNADLIIPAGAVWKYLDTGTDQGTAWRAIDFDDSMWSVGRARLGYGGDGEVTTIGYGSDANNKHITSYFRRAFTVTQPSRYAGLLLNVQRDDGAVVYLNADELLRTNLLDGDVVSTTLATSPVGGVAESTWYSTPIAPSLLITGVNIIAVEVHQVSGDSSDLGFDLMLRGEPHLVFLPFVSR